MESKSTFTTITSLSLSRSLLQHVHVTVGTLLSESTESVAIETVFNNSYSH